MKNAFLRLISPLVKLWRTLIKYVRAHVYKQDVTGDGYDDVIISSDVSYVTSIKEQHNNIKVEEECNDTESNCILESSGDEEIQSSQRGGDGTL